MREHEATKHEPSSLYPSRSKKKRALHHDDNEKEDKVQSLANDDDDNTAASDPKSHHTDDDDSAHPQHPSILNLKAPAPQPATKTNGSFSSVLQSILESRNMTCTEFVESYWQTKPLLFPQVVVVPLFSPRETPQDETNNDTSSSTEQDDFPTHSHCNPLEQLVHQGWSFVSELLHESMKREDAWTQSNSRMAKDDSNNDNQTDGKQQEPSSPPMTTTPSPTTSTPSSSSYFEPTLFLQNQQSLSMEERLERYGNSLFAAYLDGCSLVHNHAELLHGTVAALCHELEQPSSQSFTPLVLPHVYANVYITPPDAQTVPAHADDRDVFVVQVQGQKHWTVSARDGHHPLPYPHQQVGKAPDRPVPPAVLDCTVLQVVLRPGDVLYIPRGYVHAAHCTNNHPSVHVTLAIPTHDWTMAGMVSELTQTVLMEASHQNQQQQQLVSNTETDMSTSHDELLEFQKSLSIPRHPNWKTAPPTREQQQALEHQLDRVFVRLRQLITAHTIYQHLQHKYHVHHQRALEQRRPLLLAQQQQRQQLEQAHCMGKVATTPLSTVKQQNDDSNSSNNKANVHTHSSTPMSLMEHVVGHCAARRITWKTYIRAATDSEKQRARRLPTADGEPENMAWTGHNHKRPRTDPPSHPRRRQVGLHVRECIGNDVALIVQGVTAATQTQQHGVNIPTACFRVGSLAREFLASSPNPRVCQLTLLCLAKQCVSLGAWAIADKPENG